MRLAVFVMVAALIIGIAWLCAIEREIGRQEILNQHVKIRVRFTELRADGFTYCIGKPELLTAEDK